MEPHLLSQLNFSNAAKVIQKKIEVFNKCFLENSTYKNKTVDSYLTQCRKMCLIWIRD